MKGRVVVLAVWCASAIFAQSGANKGTLSGRVVDAAGAPLPDAEVTAFSPGTSFERVGRTNESGRFVIPGLEPGVYELQVQGPAFSATVKNLVVAVGATVQVNVSVAIQTAPVEVDLTASFLSVVDTHNNQVVPRSAIRDLPINGRRFQDFATLTPAVLALPETRGQLSFVGQRGVNSNVMVDGLDYNDPYLGGIRGGERSLFAFTIPQSAIQEFQTVAAGHSTEYGRSTGGLLNAITRTGANALHGEAFYLLRHRDLGRRTPLGQQHLQNQHQFGGAVGGPLERDKAFFFGSVEQQLAAYPRRIRFTALDAVARSLTPDIAPAYEYFRSLERPYEQTNDATAVLGRIDYDLRQSNRLTTRYQFSRNFARNAIGSGASLNPQTNIALSANGDERDEIQTVGGELTTVITPRLFNNARAQFSREARNRRANSSEPYLQAGVIGSAGTDPVLPASDENFRFQVADAFSIVAGNHSLRFGADFSHIGVNRVFASNQYGSFLVSGGDVRQLLRVLSASGVNGNRFDDPAVIYRRQVGGPDFTARAQQLAFFAQNTWNARPNFSLNWGLRWEGQFNPSPALDNEFLLNQVRGFEFPLGRIDPTVIRDQLDQWAPQAGFAWDVSGGGTTVVRANVGVHYAQTPLLLYTAPLTNFGVPPGDAMMQLAPSSGRTIYRQFADAGFDLNASTLGNLPVLSPTDVWMRIAGYPHPYFGSRVSATTGDRFRNPRSVQSSMVIARQLPGGLVVDYTLNHVNTVHLQRNLDYNVPLPAVKPGDLSLRPNFGLRSGARRPNPNLAWVMVRDSSARSTFLGHTFRAQYQAARFQFAMHYTLSYTKSDDDTERVLTEIAYQNPFDFSRDFNWSALDARHQASGWMLVRAPFGIEVTGLARFRSGLPIDPYTGEDSSELLTPNLTTRPLERSGVPYLRNTFRNRGYKSVDLRVLKEFRLAETASLQFSAELFNAFDFDNVAFLSTSILPNNPAFIYGPGILPNGQMAPIDPRFLRLRGPDGSFDSGTTAQIGTPLRKGNSASASFSEIFRAGRLSPGLGRTRRRPAGGPREPQAWRTPTCARDDAEEGGSWKGYNRYPALHGKPPDLSSDGCRARRGQSPGARDKHPILTA